jgi:hypothetical protein
MFPPLTVELNPLKLRFADDPAVQSPLSKVALAIVSEPTEVNAPPSTLAHTS